MDRGLWGEGLAAHPEAKALGFEVLDINVAHPERFPTEAVREKVKEVGIEVVTTIGLPFDSNLMTKILKQKKGNQQR